MASLSRVALRDLESRVVEWDLVDLGKLGSMCCHVRLPGEDFELTSD
jgi:hypothetical protein